MLKLRFAVVLSCLLTVGCAGLQEKTREAKFEDTARQYRLALRWGYYEKAASFVKTGAEKTLPDVKGLKDVRVTGYDEKGIKMAVGDPLTIKNSVEIHYYRDANPVERSLSEIQTWKYDPEIEKWVLTSGLPKFR
jgi:hypothetical protein